jgi:hypothetical protein
MINAALPNIEAIIGKWQEIKALLRHRIAAPAEPPADDDTPIRSVSDARMFKRLKAGFDHEVTKQVTRHINEYLLPQYKERLEKADAVLRRHAGRMIFSNAEYRIIAAALHPDSSSEMRASAFPVFAAKETLLRGSDKPLASNLPTSLAELDAMKEAATAERRAKRQQRAESATNQSPAATPDQDEE